MKPLNKVLKNLNDQYDHDIPTVVNYLQKGRNKNKLIAKLIQGVSMVCIRRDIDLPKLSTKDPIQERNLWSGQAKHLGLYPKDLRYTIIGFSDKFKQMKEEGKLKLPHTLTKNELFEQINSELVCDANGKPIQLSVREKDGTVKLLWNNKTNTPIYKRKRNSGPKKGLPEALKCHLYELHKMKKWDKRHPAPTELQLKQDLFPDSWMMFYNLKRDSYLEHVRNMLSNLYCNHKKTTIIIPMAPKTNSTLAIAA